MISTIFGSENSYPATAAANYIHPSATLLGSWNATEASRVQVIPSAFDLSELYVLLDVAPGAGKSWAFTIMKNGVATAINLTISDSSTSATYAGAAVPFAAGDTISLRSVPTGTPTTGTNLWWNMKCSGTGFPLLGSNTSNLATSPLNYGSPMGVSNVWGTSLAAREIMVPTAGTFSKLFAKLNGAPSGSAQYRLEIYKNGVATGLSCIIAGTNVTANDVVNSFSVAAGDTIAIVSTPTGVPTARMAAWGLLFTPTTDGESFISYGSNAAPSNTAVTFEQPLGHGGNSWNATERQLVIGPYTLTKQQVKLSTSPGAGRSWDFVTRKNAADTALATNLLATTTGSTTASVAFAQGDKLALELTPTGTPTVFTDAKWGAVIYVAPAGGPANTTNFFNFF